EIAIAANGERFGTTYAGANGYHYGLFEAGTFNSGNTVFGWLVDDDESGNSIKSVDASGHIEGLHLWRDTVRVESDLTNLTEVNGFLSDAWSQLDTFDNEAHALYTVGAEPDLLLNDTIGFRLDNTYVNDFAWDRPLDATTGTVTIVKPQGGSVVQADGMGLEAGALRLIGSADTNFLFGNA